MNEEVPQDNSDFLEDFYATYAQDDEPFSPDVNDDSKTDIVKYDDEVNIKIIFSFISVK